MQIGAVVIVVIVVVVVVVVSYIPALVMELELLCLSHSGVKTFPICKR